MTCPCPGYLHAQGRDCRCSLIASRAALMLPAEPSEKPNWNDAEGAHLFNGGIVFPNEPDEPVVTPEEAGTWSVVAQIACIAVVVACLAFAFIQIVLPAYYH